MTTKNYLIVVGVDGSAGGRAALHWAIREARSRGGSVQAVNAWRWEFPELRTEDTDKRQSESALHLLQRELEAVPPHEISGVPIACEAVEGQPGDVLTEAATTADLLVLGSHGHGRMIHQLLGSVIEDCIRKSTCPVVVIPAAVRTGDSGEQLVAERARVDS